MSGTAPRRPTIAVDARSLVGSESGIGVATRALLGALAERARARYIAMAHASIDGDGLRRRGVEVEVQGAPLGVLWQQLVLPRRLRRGDIDLFWSPLFTLPWRSPVPAVSTIHDLTPLLFPELHHWRVRWSLRPFLGRSIRTARTVVVDSSATARDVAQHFPASRSKLVTVPMGVGAEFRPGERTEIEATHRELAAAGGYILHVGTLEPRKNIDRLLDVWSRLRDDAASAPPLVLVGGRGWHCEALVRRIESLAGAGLHYLGHVEPARLVRLYQAATAFVFPSLYEGFGLPPLEAMACGVPTATSNRSSLPEVVGDGALTFDPEDTTAMTSVLRRLLHDEEARGRLSARGIERAAELTWDAAAEQMEEVLFRALPPLPRVGEG